MKNIEKFIIPLLAVLLFAALFFRWFLPFPLSTGDWSYKFPSAISEYGLYPHAWNMSFGSGFGGNDVFLLALNSYFYSTTSVLFNYLHLPWIAIEKIVWYWPYIIVSSAGAFFLFRKFFVNDTSLACISSVIFVLNTYALLIVGGGQMGVAMGYAMLPWVFYAFLSVLNETNRKKAIRAGVVAGIIFSIQLLFDLRIAYVSVMLIGIYYVLYLITHKFISSLKETLIPFGIVPALIIFLLNFFWIVPFILFGQNPLVKLGDAFSGTGIISFLSFANFENTISLLHPNWPDNLFGKVYFMRPEFLVIPILAFGLLLLLKNDKQKYPLLALSFIALLGAFLAKGANPPFGETYIWMFEKIPGFMMFRDSSKWYGMVALAYCILIPYMLSKVSGVRLKVVVIKKHIYFAKYVLPTAFLAFWLFTLRPAYTGDLKGTFISKNEPQEYVQLAKFIEKDKGFYRTLWVPTFHQYTYYSNTHPAIPGADYYLAYNAKSISSKINKDKDNLAMSSVKYIIVPEDTEGKIFQNDRKYSEKIYQTNIDAIKKIQGIREVKRFGKIVVFEAPNIKDHFWSSDPDVTISYTSVSPVEYQVTLKNVKAGDVLIFSEAFDNHWVMSGGQFAQQQSKSYKGLNGFDLPISGDYEVKVYYMPQDWVNMGLIVSGISLVGIVGYLLYSRKYK